MLQFIPFYLQSGLYMAEELEIFIFIFQISYYFEKNEVIKERKNYLEKVFFVVYED